MLELGEVVPDLGLPATKSYCGFSQDNTWVTHNDKRVLWLPPRYRPFSRSWDANDRFIGIHTHLTLVNEFCCNVCSAKISNGSNELVLCKETITGRYENMKEPKDISTGKFKTILGLLKDKLLRYL